MSYSTVPLSRQLAPTPTITVGFYVTGLGSVVSGTAIAQDIGTVTIPAQVARYAILGPSLQIGPMTIVSFFQRGGACPTGTVLRTAPSGGGHVLSFQANFNSIANTNSMVPALVSTVANTGTWTDRTLYINQGGTGSVTGNFAFYVPLLPLEWTA